MTSTKISAVALAALLGTPISAQLEETKLPFVAADLAFEQAAASGKRVLLYQDWPG